MAQLPGGSASDFWWLKPQPADDPLPAIRMGMQNAHQQRLDKIALAEQAYKAQVREQMSLGGAEFAGVVADIYRSGDIASPESQAKLYDVGKKYPYLLGTEPWNGLQRQIEEAEKLRLRKELIDNAGFDPGNEALGIPPHYVDARGGVRFPMQQKSAAVFVPANKEEGTPAYFRQGNGTVKIVPEDGSVSFEGGKEITTQSGVVLTQVSPKQWRVTNHPPISGKMNDSEINRIRDIRAETARLEKAIEDLGGPPKPGVFGGESKQMKDYKARTDRLDALRTEREKIYREAEARQAGTPTPTADPNIIREAYKAGKITKEEAVEQLRKLGFQ